MAQRKRGERVLGPYQHRGRWRLIVVGPGGEKSRRYYASKETAQRVKRSTEEELRRVEDRTVKEAREEYEVYLRDEKHNLPGSVEDTMYRLDTFFVGIDGEGAVAGTLDEAPLSSISPEKAQALYDSLRTRKKRNGKTLAVDSHRNILAEAKTFLGWCVGKRWLARNPLEKVKGVGKRRHGKEQLRIGETRKWLTMAIELADKGKDGPVAAMTCLLMGMRCTEVVSRVVRDLDDDGKLLWIPWSKTAAGKRTLEVPQMLQPYLSRLAGKRKPDEPLFRKKHLRDWPRRWVKRICKLAGVPEVSAHSMRGLHGTLAIKAGATGHLVAASLGHESETTSFQSYVTPEAAVGAKQERLLTLLGGGKKLAS
jgi:integrase